MVTADTRTTNRGPAKHFSSTCATSCTFMATRELHSWNSISIGHFVTASQLLIPLCNSECEVLFGRELYARVSQVYSGKVKAALNGLPLLFVLERTLAPVPRLVSCFDSLLGIFAHNGRGNSTLKHEKRGRDALRCASMSIELIDGRTPRFT